MADRKHLLHVKSNVAETARQYGIDDFLVTPKKPVDSNTGKATDDTLMYGEIAVNYGKGVEALTIRNTEDDVIAFVNENDFNEAGEIAAAGLATEKTEREAADAIEKFERETADTTEKTERIEADANEKREREEADATEKTAREEAFNQLNDKIDNLEVGGMVSTTYAEIKGLRDQSNLKPGQFYRITDYVTTTTQSNTQSANHAFDVIVIATDVDTLNENAKAIHHEGDTYFADSNLDAWEIKYDLDNDTTKYAWADATNGKGVIFYMKDEWDNECPYDFKNIQFKRWAVSDVQNSELDSTTLDNLKDIYVYDDDNSKFITRYAYKNSNCVYGSTTHVVNSNDSDWYYTFSTFKFENEIYALDEIEDASIKGNNFYSITIDSGGCFGNSIKPYYNNKASNDGGIDGTQYLNNIVFNGYYQTIEKGYAYHCFANSIGYNSYNNTFGNSCDSNTFGDYFRYNTFGSGCDFNTFGNNCSDNTFGNNCIYNIFGNSCGDNTFGNSCNYNIFGNSCGDNTFGTDCWSNSFGNDLDNSTFGGGCWSNSFGNNFENITFGNGCSQNSFGNDGLNTTFGNICSNNTFGNNSSATFGNNCNHNTFGNFSGYNTFGNKCDYNTFGNNCDNNTFVNNCKGNTFGNSVRYVKFVKDYMHNNIIENGNTFITVTSTRTTSESVVLKNFTIAQGVNNGSSEAGREIISHDIVSDTFRVTYQDSNSQFVSV